MSRRAYISTTCKNYILIERYIICSAYAEFVVAGAHDSLGTCHKVVHFLKKRGERVQKGLFLYSSASSIQS